MTSRVVLRTPAPSDEDEFIALMRASRRLHRPWLYPPLTRESYHAYLARIAEERHEGFLARRREDSAIVGWLNVSEIVRGPFQSAYLGYGAVAAFAGRGYMSEALRLLVRHAFSTMKLHRLEANIQPRNHASIALSGAAASSARATPRAI